MWDICEERMHGQSDREDMRVLPRCLMLLGMTPFVAPGAGDFRVQPFEGQSTIDILLMEVVLGSECAVLLGSFRYLPHPFFGGASSVAGRGLLTAASTASVSMAYC